MSKTCCLWSFRHKDTKSYCCRVFELIKAREDDSTISIILKTRWRFVNQCKRAGRYTLKRALKSWVYPHIHHVRQLVRAWSLAMFVTRSCGFHRRVLLRWLCVPFSLIAWMSYFCFVFPCGFMTVLNICLFHTPPLDPILSSLFTFPHCNLCSTGFLVRVSCWAGDSQLLSYFGRMHVIYFPFGFAIFPIHSFVSLVVSTQELRRSYCTCQTWKDSYHAG